VWGANFYGQTNVPPGLTNVVSVASGSYHVLALRKDGSVVCWGHNSNGQTNVPTGLGQVVAVAAGMFHSLALKADGTVVGWGSDDTEQIDVPSGLNPAIGLGAGGKHSMAIVSPSGGAPRIDSVTRSGQNVNIRFRTTAGQQYALEYSPTSASGAWSVLQAGITGTGQVALITDTNAVSQWNSRFYRIRRSL
jgi:alpha-tubulin suppressor-like RCC1 family protein